jgi:hypothetical protein
MPEVPVSEDKDWKILLGTYCDALDHLIRLAKIPAIDENGHSVIGRDLERYRRQALLAAGEGIFIAHSDVLSYRRNGVFVKPLLHLQTPETAHIYLGLQWSYSTAAQIVAPWGFRDAFVLLKDGTTRFLRVSPERKGNYVHFMEDGLKLIGWPPESDPLLTIPVELVHELNQAIGLLRTPSLAIPPSMEEFPLSLEYEGIQFFEKGFLVRCGDEIKSLHDYEYYLVYEIAMTKDNGINFPAMKKKRPLLKDYGRADRIIKSLPKWLSGRIVSGKGYGYKIKVNNPSSG